MKNVKMVVALLASAIVARAEALEVGIQVSNIYSAPVRVSFGRTRDGMVANDEYNSGIPNPLKLNKNGWTKLNPLKSGEKPQSFMRIPNEVYVSLDSDNSHRLKSRAFDLKGTGVSLASIVVKDPDTVLVYGTRNQGKDLVRGEPVKGMPATTTCTAPCTCTCPK